MKNRSPYEDGPDSFIGDDAVVIPMAQSLVKKALTVRLLYIVKRARAVKSWAQAAQILGASPPAVRRAGEDCVRAGWLARSKTTEISITDAGREALATYIAPDSEGVQVFEAIHSLESAGLTVVGGRIEQILLPERTTVLDRVLLHLQKFGPLSPHEIARRCYCRVNGRDPVQEPTEGQFQQVRKAVCDAAREGLVEGVDPYRERNRVYRITQSGNDRLRGQ